jgi:ABC-type sugar transport system ATPase subunit
MSERMTSVFRAESITHDYSGVVVLFDVDFEFETGRVEALVGENGSGKSTLIKIITGAQRPTEGALTIDRNPVSFRRPADAQAEGVAVVHQDYNLLADLTVAENVLRLNVPPPRRRPSMLVDRHTVDEQVKRLFESLAVQIPSGALVRNLSPAERKFAEIARAMLLKPRFLVLDEPTASLEPEAASNVLGLVDRLKGQGVGVVFVSHRLDEVLRIADNITGLRDGRVVGRLPREEASEERLARLIVGEERRRAAGPGRARTEVGDASGAATNRGENGAPAEKHSGAIALRVRRISAHGGDEQTLEVRSREIIGLTGLLDSGAAHLTHMLGGLVPGGIDVEVYGREVRIDSPHDARRAGIGFIPEDRKALGIVPDQSVAVNISLASLPKVATAGVLSRSRLDRRAHEYRDRLDIRVRSIHARASTLSGGNAQKVLIARWLASGVRILVVEEPTHGIDIGAKKQVHALLAEFAAAGGALLIASTDVKDILALCDRIAIFHHGTLAEIVSKQDLAEARLQGATSRTDEEHLLERLIAGVGSDG